MKHNYKLILSYDGTRYKGWERQPTTDMTIQGKLENVLTRMAGEPVEVTGCGRTDAGVHAMAYVCNVRLDTDMEPEEICRYVNLYLPEDICVQEVRIASERFHSRYNAIGKTYRYTCYIGDAKPVFNRKCVYTFQSRPDGKPIPRESGRIHLDIDAMRRAAELLMGQHDYAGFCTNPHKRKSTVRKVDLIDVRTDGEGYLYLTYHGNGFLHHMVRILTGTLLEVGIGERDAESIADLLELKDRKRSGFTAPAQGLCLMEVDYQ